MLMKKLVFGFITSILCDLCFPMCLSISELIKISTLRTSSQNCGGSVKRPRNQGLPLSLQRPAYHREIGTDIRFTKNCRMKLGRREEHSGVWSWNENMGSFEIHLYLMTWGKLSNLSEPQILHLQGNETYHTELLTALNKECINDPQAHCRLKSSVSTQITIVCKTLLWFVFLCSEM